VNPKDLPKQSDRVIKIDMFIGTLHEPFVSLEQLLRLCFHVSTDWNLLNSGQDLLSFAGQEEINKEPRGIERTT
jgi:hypothetical protein